MNKTAWEIFDIRDGKVVALVATEAQAEVASRGPFLDYEEVKMSPCYCDSAYHSLGHKV